MVRGQIEGMLAWKAAVDGVGRGSRDCCDDLHGAIWGGVELPRRSVKRLEGKKKIVHAKSTDGSASGLHRSPRGVHGEGSIVQTR